MADYLSKIKDEPRTDIYFIYGENEMSKNKMAKLLEKVNDMTDKNCVLLGSKDEPHVADIINFFHLSGKEFVLIVGAHKQLHQAWTDADGKDFDASEIAHRAERIR
jgi:hypothetical protein